MVNQKKGKTWNHKIVSHGLVVGNVAGQGREEKKILVILRSSTRGKMRDSVANIMGVAMFTASKLSKVCQVWPKKFW